MEDPKNARGGDGWPKKWGVEMNLGIFLGGRGILLCYIKCEQTLKMGGGQNFF